MADQTSYVEQVARQAPFLEDYQRRLLASTQTLTDKPYQQYGGAQLAGFSADQLASFNLARQGIGSYAPFLAESGVYARGAPAAFAATVPEAQRLYRASTGQYGVQGTQTAGAFTPMGTLGAPVALGQYGTQAFNPATGVQAYMDPYLQDVKDVAMADINREAAMAAQQQAAQAVAAGAFGGGREGVQRAEMARNVLDAKAKALAGIQQAGYAQALQASMSDFARQQQAAQQAFEAQRGALLSETGRLSGQQLSALESAEQRRLAEFGRQQAASQQAYESQRAAQQAAAAGLSGLGAQGAGLMQQASSQMAGLGGLTQQYGAADVSMLSQSGALQQQQMQRALDIDRQKFLEAQMQPYQRMAFMSDILRGVPSTQSTLTSSTAPAPSAAAQGIGALGAIAGIGGQSGFGWWGDK